MMGSKNHQQIPQRGRGAALVGLALITLAFTYYNSRRLTSPRQLMEHFQIVDDASSSSITKGKHPSCISSKVLETAKKQENFVLPPVRPPKKPGSGSEKKEKKHLLRASVRQTETLSNYTYMMHHQIPVDDVKWPQTDDRIRQAIRNGERIGPKSITILTRNDGTRYYDWKGIEHEAPQNKLATVVSMFYDISSKKEKARAKSGLHRKEAYIRWMENFLSSTDPLVFFCEPESPWADIVREKRQHAPTIIAYLYFSELTTNTNFDEKFWVDRALNKDLDGVIYVKKKKTGQYKLWNEKIILIHETSLVNPFDSEHFVWIDAGYYRGIEARWPEGQRPQSPAVNGVIVRNNMTKNGLWLDQLLVHNAEPESRGYAVTGGAWGGSALGIQNAYEHYWKTFWFMAQNDNTWCIGYEQHVMTHMCKSFPKVCLIQESLDDTWRQMGEVILRDPNYDLVSNAIILNPANERAVGDDESRKAKWPKLKTMPVSGKVDFPKDFPIKLPPEDIAAG